MITFITNSKKLGSKNLKDRLQEVIEITTELKILVGYFHFSGINELYETLRKLYKENKLSQGHIKILVGKFNNKDEDKNKDADTEVRKFNEKNNDKESKERFIRDLIYSIQEDLVYSAQAVFYRTQRDSNENNIYNMIDTKEKQVKFFIELLEKKIIVIKKTKQDNHSKLYLFKTKDILTPYLLIIGSSNLTNLGLTGRSENGYGNDIWQDELNIEIRGCGVEEVEKYFDDLWKNAISLLEDDDDINKIKEKLFSSEKSSTEKYMVEVYVNSCLDMLRDKENRNLEKKDYYIDKIKKYDPYENKSSKPAEKSVQQLGNNYYNDDDEVPF